MSNARYHSITLKPDPASHPGAYELQFSTMPGMSTTITDLRMGDLDALADILSSRDVAANGATVATPPRRWPPEACRNCGGVGSGCHCD